VLDLHGPAAHDRHGQPVGYREWTRLQADRAYGHVAHHQGPGWFVATRWEGTAPRPGPLLTWRTTLLHVPTGTFRRWWHASHADAERGHAAALAQMSDLTGHDAASPRYARPYLPRPRQPG
jgi:hypothetical protein